MNLAEPARVPYKFRVGKKWVVAQEADEGCLNLVLDEANAGHFMGAVRAHKNDYHGPAVMVGFIKDVFKHDGAVWCKPVSGAPGFWMY